MPMGEAGTGTAEKWWKTVWSQMVKQEGSSPCLRDQHPQTPERKKHAAYGKRKGKKLKYLGENTESVKLNSVLEGLRK